MALKNLACGIRMRSSRVHRLNIIILINPSWSDYFRIVENFTRLVGLPSATDKKYIPIRKYECRLLHPQNDLHR